MKEKFCLRIFSAKKAILTLDEKSTVLYAVTTEKENSTFFVKCVTEKRCGMMRNRRTRNGPPIHKDLGGSFEPPFCCHIVDVRDGFLTNLLCLL